MTPDGPARRNAARWILPPAASIAVHAGLLAALAAVTVEVTREKPAPKAQRVTLAAPATPPPVSESLPATPPPPGGPEAAAPGAIPAPAEPAAVARAAEAAVSAPAATARPPQPKPAPMAEAMLGPSSAAAPTVRFADVDATPARSVVFVVDASGAVASAFTFVREELLRSIDQLSPTQRFQVIVFPGPDGTPPQVSPVNRGGLALATPASKKAVAEWMESFRPRGASEPLAGLRRALEMRPDLVMLITRSIERTGPHAAWGAGLHDTLDELDRLNPADRAGRRRTAIAAVQLLDPDPTGIMPAIAARHGQGVTDYRVVSADNLASMQARPPRARGNASDTVDAAASLLAELDDAGVALRVVHGLPDEADRTRARELASQAAGLAAREPDDARARVLFARARSLAGTPDADAVSTLGAELLHDADADAWRRLALVDTLTLSGRPDDALAELDALAADARELPLSPATLARIAVTGAALGRGPADLEAALRAPPLGGARAGPDPYWTLAMAEAMVRSRLRAGDSDPYRPLLDLLAWAQREGVPSWTPLAHDRMARAAALAPDTLRHAPGVVRLAVAEAWSRSPATRADAEELLESLIGRDAPERPAALWRLALLDRARTPSTEAARRRAAERFATLAIDHPDHPDAPDALAAAIALTGDPDALRPLLDRAVRTLPDRPEIDLWRLNLAELSEGTARLDALEPVTPGTREATLARAAYAETAESVLAASPDENHAALALRTAAYLARHDAPEAPAWLVRASAALLSTEPVRAIELAEQALTRARALGRPTEDAELALARAQVAAKRTANALTTLTALATRLDAEGSRGPAFWEAWTLLLEVGGPHDPEAARAHLARLTLLDPRLGGSPWSDRLNALRAELDTTTPGTP